MTSHGIASDTLLQILLDESRMTHHLGGQQAPHFEAVERRQRLHKGAQLLRARRRTHASCSKPISSPQTTAAKWKCISAPKSWSGQLSMAETSSGKHPLVADANATVCGSAILLLVISS